MKTRLIGAILAIVLAITGTIVLTGYVRGADARASAGAAFVRVYVVTRDIPAGTTAADIGSLIVEKQIPSIAAAAGRVTRLSALAGMVADVALVPGEQLLTARWVNPSKHVARGEVAVPKGMQAITIALPVEQVVGGTVKAGDTVGVIISATLKPAGSDEISTSKQVFHKVLVTAVQQGTTTRPGKGNGASTDPVSEVMVTLARSSGDVEKLVWGQEFGKIWLTFEPKGADESGSRTVDGGVVFQ
ncbi:MAG TPA: Flp pilus assembly protein CpaB [Microbacteriaceae bacterium]|jgi:pilus assembly protein CpaB|nr:Flp pilus assembly protein CpaB [Microbacteriaceae bacterium]